MGQKIEVNPRVVDDVVIIDTDRSITGQDGTEYASAEAAAADDRFPGRLAARLFAGDNAVRHVWVGSNVVVVRRDAGWDDAAVTAAAAVVSDFFLYY